jgi:hypothetical protein
MANVDYLTCSFCQGPSSRLLRPKLAQHLLNPACRIRPSDLDWLDNWRLLLPAHVEWDLHRLQDTDFQHEYESELPKTNVVSGISWVPSIEGRISDTPDWDDLDGWRTIEFTPRPQDESEFGDLDNPFSIGVGGNVISKRALHPYNDDIEATRLPFHSVCLRILYENCNEVAYSTYATSTVSDVVAAILLPSWREGDVNMDWVPAARREMMGKKRLITPWGEHWNPLDPETNVPSSTSCVDLVSCCRSLATSSFSFHSEFINCSTSTKCISPNITTNASRSPRFNLRLDDGNNNCITPSN